MKKVVSLFDGLSCGNIALDYLLKDNKNARESIQYFASEINEYSMKVAKHNYPGIMHIGDVRTVTRAMVGGDVFMIIAGSPCTDFSIAGKKRGMTTEDENLPIESLDDYLRYREMGYEFVGSSYLFWEFVRLIRELKPKYFMLENVVLSGDMKKWERIITKELGVEPIVINSNLVSAQNRNRIYWTNIPGASVPEDEHIMASDVIPGAIAGHGKRGTKKKGELKYSYPATTRKDGKFNCITTKRGNNCKYETVNGEILELTVSQMEMLQTFPKDYTKVEGMSDTKRIEMIGNSWTAKVIEHLFKGLKNEFVV